MRGKDSQPARSGEVFDRGCSARRSRARNLFFVRRASSSLRGVDHPCGNFFGADLEEEVSHYDARSYYSPAFRVPVGVTRVTGSHQPSAISFSHLRPPLQTYAVHRSLRSVSLTLGRACCWSNIRFSYAHRERANARDHYSTRPADADRAACVGEC